jgi:hypothetical protein
MDGKTAQIKGEVIMAVTHLDLNAEQLNLLCDLYAEANRTLDDLPYTPEFDDLYQQFCEETALDTDRHSVWKALCNCRKARRLVRKSR